MALVTRTYTFTDGTTAYGSQVEAEIANIVNTLNSLDTVSLKWNQVSILNATNVPLTADNSSGSQDIVDFKANGVIKVSVSSTGLLKPANGVTVSGASLTMSGQTIVMGSNKITGLANGTAATDAGAFGQIKVLQTVFASSTTNFSTTSATYQTTNLSGSITPTSASNRILIITSGVITNNSNNDNALISLFNGASNLMAATGSGSLFSNGTGVTTLESSSCLCWIDSPASTSAQTYSVKLKNTGNVVTVQFGRTGTQSMILMEIV